MTDDDNIKLQKKLYFMVDKLKEFHGKLDTDIQNRIPLENLITMGKLCLTICRSTVFDFLINYSKCLGE